MSRLDTMARFEAPTDEEPVCECEFCGNELFVGDRVYKCNSEVYCSTECVAGAYCYEEELGD